MNKPPITVPAVKMEIIDDILHGTFLPGSVITIDIAKEMVKRRLEYSEGKPYPILLSGEGTRAINKDARDYLSNEGQEGVSAGAILVHSVYTEFFGNFFLKVTQSKVPAKLFTDKEKALEWLEQFKNKSK